VSFHDIPLLISLIFGAGQVLFGVAVLARGVRRGRWHGTGMFLLMVLGIWALGSGAAELLVSGLAVASRTHGAPTAASVATVRRAADDALIALSIALVVPVALFAVWKRATAGSGRPRGVARPKD
jgi:hypothetical protein